MTRRQRPGHRLTSPEALRREILAWAVRLCVTPKAICLQRMTRKWGSCSPRGRVCFATDLLGESADFRTAVIVHELLHLAVPNHGKLFKSFMNAYLPGWQRTDSRTTRPLCTTNRRFLVLSRRFLGAGLAKH
jgi:predicted metal-dependent hydrolase